MLSSARLGTAQCKRSGLNIKEGQVRVSRIVSILGLGGCRALLLAELY